MDFREQESSDIGQYYVFIKLAECGHKTLVTKICNGGRQGQSGTPKSTGKILTAPAHHRPKPPPARTEEPEEL